MRLFWTLITCIVGTYSFAAVKCADFDTQAQAQKYFLAKKPGYKRLDRDHDGEACECLKGGSGYYKSSCKHWRKRYGKQ